METSLPDELTLSLRVTVAGATATESPSSSSTGELAATLTGALAAGELRPVERWLIPRDAKAQTGDWRAALEELTARPGRPPDGRLHLGGGQVVDIAAQGADRSRWRVVLHTTVDKAHPADFPSLLERHARFCRYWLQAGQAGAGAVESGLLQWTGGAARCLPVVPLVGDHSHLLVTTRAQIDASYDSPQAFFDAGWDGCEQYGIASNQTLVFTRAMDVTSSVGYLRAVLPQQWALAHASRPKRTRYELPNPLPAEQPLYNAGEQTLHVRGYRAGEKCMEYNCFPAGNAHVPGWEVLGLYGVLRRGALPDGLPVSAVRVCFQQKELALREKRTLLDVGAIVAYNAAGRWIDVVE